MREPDNQEQQFVIRARSGDVEAFEYLYRSYNSRIYNFVSQIVMSEHEARDVVQETFIKAWRSLPSLRSDSAFKDWLYRIALNRAKDKLKHRSRLSEVNLEPLYCDGETGECSIPADSESPERTAQANELSEAVKKAICELSADHRAVIALHHLQDMEVEEIAGILGVPVGTVLSRLARARSVLRRKLSWYVE